LIHNFQYLTIMYHIRYNKDLWEARSKITEGKIARVIFYISNGEMILLHGFVKKSQKTPKKEIDLAVKRQKEHQKYDR
jgi:phage-related protein